jgi:hypothetical protein
MIRTLAPNITPNLKWFQDDWKTPPETASDEMVIREAWALSEFSLPVFNKINLIYPSHHQMKH